MYAKNVEHTAKIPLVDSLGDALSTAPTITISKDGGAFAAVTNTPTAVGSTWHLVVTASEANCDDYTLHITHDDLAMPVFYQDQAGTAVGVSVVMVGTSPVELMEDSFLDAAGARAALGMAEANLDTQLGGVPTATKAAMEAEGSHLALILEDMAAIPTANDVADALLGRDASEVEDTAPEHSLCTVILAMLESSVSGTTWTIKRTNGETTHATKTITTDADAEPITGVS